MSRDQVKKRRGYGGTITMVTCLIEFHPSASFHVVIVDLSSKEPE
jgi:hypothetical protein